MKSIKAVIADDVQSSLTLIAKTLQDARIQCVPVNSPNDAIAVVQSDESVRIVVVRFQAASPDACLLASELRKFRTADELQILVVVPEGQQAQANLAVRSGADGILFEPFEARELRMLVGISIDSRSRRVDLSHRGTDSESEPDSKGHTMEVPAEGSVLVKPRFDSATLRFSYDEDSEVVQEWYRDDRVTRVPLDQVMVCPECSSLPTFRHGCPHCGSAAVSREALIHHFACAHVGPVSDFRKAGDLVCPKCQLHGLVAGSDFEVVSGNYRCDDCGHLSHETELIGHCLACEHRFSAKDAVLLPLIGFHVPGSRLESSGPRLSGTQVNAGQKSKRVRTRTASPLTESSSPLAR